MLKKNSESSFLNLQMHVELDFLALCISIDLHACTILHGGDMYQIVSCLVPCLS